MKLIIWEIQLQKRKDLLIPIYRGVAIIVDSVNAPFLENSEQPTMEHKKYSLCSILKIVCAGTHPPQRPDKGDGSYVCVYFNDYLMLRPGDELPTGYIRYTTTEEKNMLHQMAEDYEVDPVYVLDLYRHGKVNWMLDFAIRAEVGVLLLLVGSVIRVKKNKT